MDETLTRGQRHILHLGALCVVIAWLCQLALSLFIAGVVICGLVAHRGRVQIQGILFGLLFVLPFGLFLLSGFGYLTLAFCARCPACHFALLRNPKGLGPTGLKTHPNCKKVRGLNSWSYQIVRAVRHHAIICLQCGREYNLR